MRWPRAAVLWLALLVIAILEVLVRFNPSHFKGVILEDSSAVEEAKSLTNPA